MYKFEVLCRDYKSTMEMCEVNESLLSFILNPIRFLILNIDSSQNTVFTDIP